MTEVTVLFLDQTFASTAVGPLEVFNHAGSLWNLLTGLRIDEVAEYHAPIISWLQRWQKRGAAIASVCTGVGLVAATGMLDGKRATTHWALADRFRQLYPKVKWMPELMVTEDRSFYC